MKEKIRIEVPIETAKHIADALDFYSRVAIGQTETLTDLFRSEIAPIHNRKDISFDQFMEKIDAIESLVNEIKEEAGFAPGQSLGILNTGVNKGAQRCYEVFKEIRQRLHHHSSKNVMSVDADGNSLNLLGTPQEDLPKSEIFYELPKKKLK